MLRAGDAKTIVAGLRVHLKDLNASKENDVIPEFADLHAQPTSTARTMKCVTAVYALPDADRTITVQAILHVYQDNA